ncbi:hypothetical protein BT63DRAFT_366381 [Microthyrium microscopicum]|uniref:Uncharacterized protein n=1 Tax=Microthyrium microscopicum TaxID=703497 RepID=A0A6A6URM9_9PEZI|nr:hypothetical protein BT63DRAFT_366381 [Microthyrium microscopicum]
MAKASPSPPASTADSQCKKPAEKVLKSGNGALPPPGGLENPKGDISIAKDGAAEKFGHQTLSDVSPHDISVRSPTIMLSFWVSGMLLCVGHHLFYRQIENMVVQSAGEQQWNIRIGSIFALVIKMLLAGSVWCAYKQCLWRTMKRKYISLRGLDAAFSVEMSIMGLFNPELVFKIKTGAVLALIGWCLQIPPLVTPATLTVVSSTDDQSMKATVASLAITNPIQAHKYAYYTPMKNSVPDAVVDSFNFESPRSIVSRIASATASFGQILPINSPFSFSTYNLTFIGPYVNCIDGNATVQEVTEGVLSQVNKTLEQTGLDEAMAYYAYVPSFDTNATDFYNVTVGDKTYTARDLPRLQKGPVNATNELWMKYYRYPRDSNGNYALDLTGNPMAAEPRYSVCSLWNATYDLSFEFQNGTQAITKNDIQLLNTVHYPKSDPYRVTDVQQLSYSAVFWVLADQLVGSLGFVVYNKTGLPNYNAINSNIEHNSVIGSNDLDYFFNQNASVHHQSFNIPVDGQRLLDKNLAHSRTMPRLAEELMFNITISMINDPLLAPIVNTTVKHTNPVNRYTYSARNLWIAYGLALLLSLFAILLGLLAFLTNEASHDNSFSTIMSITRDPALGPLFPDCCHGKLPLPSASLDAKLRIREMEGGGESLMPVGHVPIVCTACMEKQGNVMDGQRPGRLRRSIEYANYRLRSQEVPRKKGATTMS